MPNLRPPDERLCPVCLGYGFVLVDLPSTHPHFGRARACPTCGNEQQQAHLAAMSGLNQEMQRVHFAHLSRLPHLAAALDAAQALAADAAGFLTLVGANGRGKSTILAAIVNAGRMGGRRSVYASTADFLDHLRNAYAPNVNLSYDGVWERYEGATILCLDELDAFKVSEWAEEKFRQMIDHRYRDRSQKLTCFATNANLTDLPPYLYSRLTDRSSHIFTLTGPDLRRL